MIKKLKNWYDDFGNNMVAYATEDDGRYTIEGITGSIGPKKDLQNEFDDACKYYTTIEFSTMHTNGFEKLIYPAGKADYRFFINPDAVIEYDDLKYRVRLRTTFANSSWFKMTPDAFDILMEKLEEEGIVNG